MQKYRKDGKLNQDMQRRARRKWTKANRYKTVIYQALSRAIARGDIVRPDRCERCGQGGMVHGHHDSYNRPFEVRWMCALCHMTIHRELRN